MNYPVQNTQQQRYLTAMKRWISTKNAGRCRQFAEEMGREQNADALPALMELLRLPNGWWRCRTTPEMCSAREAAVRAIAEIGAPDSSACLGVALFNPSPSVRAVASEYLGKAGAKAADPLCRMLTWRQNWSVEGMRVLLYTLGKSGNPNVGPTLARVILGELPKKPSRWDNEAILSLLPLILFELGLFLFAAYSIWTLDEMRFAAFIFLCILAFVFVGATFLLLLPVRASLVRKERRSLAVAACDALKTLGDKKAIPTLLTATRRNEADVVTAAKEGLASLLPKLNHSDIHWLPLQARQMLIPVVNTSDTYLTLPLLKAMEFVGPASAAYSVSQLMTKGRTALIRSEASRILPILLERQKQEQISGTLLRASAAPVEPERELLRAAHSSAPTPNEELLRPTQG